MGSFSFVVLVPNMLENVPVRALRRADRGSFSSVSASLRASVGTSSSFGRFVKPVLPRIRGFSAESIVTLRLNLNELCCVPLRLRFCKIGEVVSWMALGSSSSMASGRSPRSDSRGPGIRSTCLSGLLCLSTNAMCSSGLRRFGNRGKGV